jgi:hypothetical protein
VAEKALPSHAALDRLPNQYRSEIANSQQVSLTRGRCSMKLLRLFANPSERRKSSRHGIIHTAWVRTASDPLPFVTVLWDVSDGGARLSVAQPEAFPDTVTVTLKREDTVGTVCRIAWRDRDQIGIEFLSNADPIRNLIKQTADQSQ